MKPTTNTIFGSDNLFLFTQLCGVAASRRDKYEKWRTSGHVRSGTWPAYGARTSRPVE